VKNTLFYGDNLVIMRDRMKSESVDLIYLDPPFKSDQNYNLVYKTMTGKPVPEQAQAFCDTWDMDAEKEQVARTMPVLMREKGVDEYYVEFWNLWMKALRYTQPHLLAYLIYMVQRLLYMKTLLKPRGSIYLHCDPTASHYIKVMMDGIFGHVNFRNEVVWKRTSAHSDTKRWGSVHDTILFYSKSDKFTWNPVYLAHDKSYVDKFYRFKDEHGIYRHHEIIRTASMGPRPNLAYEYKGYTPQWGWRMIRPKVEALDKAGRIIWAKSGRPYLKRYLHEQEGTPITDVVVDIPPVGGIASERLGYPTQKPKALLKRIIEASSNPGDVVFDPFCGCGTTVYAAQETGRRWFGCDIAILAIKLIREILTGDQYRLVDGHDFVVDGIPVSVEQAEELFKKDPFQFQHWAVERVGGFPTTRKTGDLGIDGRLYFESGRNLHSMVLSVKGGMIRPTDIRDLRGVLERESDVDLAGFVSLREPTKAMWEEAATAGVFEYQGVPYRRIQLLTVREILEEKRQFETPTKIGSKIATGQRALPI
jgi:DNA modification methylase